MNDELLREKIASCNLTKSAIAESLGLSRQGFLNKLIGLREFKGSEIKKLSLILGLSAREREAIFFADYVDKNANETILTDERRTE